jgi:hypothetical protein
MADKIGMIETTDKDGNIAVSSKRAVGVPMALFGGLLMVALGVASFFVQVADGEMIWKVGTTMLAAGGGLLGIGIFENIGTKGGK